MDEDAGTLAAERFRTDPALFEVGGRQKLRSAR
jgi:hypothetical protein